LGRTFSKENAYPPHFRERRPLRLATFNVNGINGRLAVLLRWLQESQPDIVCLQELKAPQERFPAAAIRAAGYHALWHGQKSWNGVAILARSGLPIETRRGLPGDPTDRHSRYLEAAVAGMVIACLYLPNGNPAPGPKFDYKLAWFARLRRHAAALLQLQQPVVLAGDFNAIPTALDVYKPERFLADALFRPETRAHFHDLVAQGWTDALRKLHPGERIYTFWDYFRNAWPRNAGLRLDHILLSPQLAKRLAAAGVDREVRGWSKASDHAPAWIELRDAATRKAFSQPLGRSAQRQRGQVAAAARRKLPPSTPLTSSSEKPMASRASAISGACSGGTIFRLGKL